MISGRPASHAVHVRAFEQNDLDGAAALWNEAAAHQPAVFPLAEVVNALATDNLGLVAERDGTLIGAAVVQLLRDHAWVLRLGVVADESEESVCDALLAGLINDLSVRGVRRVSLLLPDGAVGVEALTTLQFSRRGGVSYYHRVLTGGGTDVMGRFGGRHIPPACSKALPEWSGRRR